MIMMIIEPKKRVTGYFLIWKRSRKLKKFRIYLLHLLPVRTSPYSLSTGEDDGSHAQPITKVLTPLFSSFSSKLLFPNLGCFKAFGVDAVWHFVLL